MSEVSIIVNNKYMAFLCSMFNGMIYAYTKGLHHDEQVKKDCEINFRRIYKLLSDDDKMSVHAELELLTNNPEEACGMMKEILDETVERLKE